MYFLRKTFELAVCLLGYWLGTWLRRLGWRHPLAFAGLCASSFGWDWLARSVLQRDGRGQRHVEFRLWRGVVDCGRYRGLCFVGQIDAEDQD